MTTVNAYSQLTLVELAKRKDPDGSMAAIVEVLAQDNEILMDALWLEANDTFSNKITRRASLPAGAWRKLNSGIAVDASRTVEAVEQIGMLEAYSRVDVDLVAAAPNPKQFRMDEASAFLEGLSQTLASTFIYGATTTAPEQFDGLAPRLASLAATTNVIGAGGSGGDTTSVFIVQWGPNRVHMVYPKGDPFMGIRHKDLGIQIVDDGSGNLYQAYVDHFQVKCGLCVKDNRCIARYTNIEVTGSTYVFDEDYLIRLLNRMPNSGRGAVIYLNKNCKSYAEIALKDKTNVWWKSGKGEGLAGEEFLYFRGNPVRVVDKIVSTETAIA